MKTVALQLIIVISVMLTANANNGEEFYQYSWEKFYALPEVNKPIDLYNPDYELLDAALFHATNEVRGKFKKPILQYSDILHRAATLHSQAMIDQDFYNHYNNQELAFYYPESRIRASGGKFDQFSENIAEYQIINTGPYYCPGKEREEDFVYFNCEDNTIYPAYTYVEYAQSVVDGWLNSPPHRKNLLSEDVEYAGCAARISKDPYKHKKAPFARITQNLGGGKVQFYNNNNSI